MSSAGCSIPREISTERCLLRVPELSDASALFGIYGDATVMRYMQRPVTSSVDDCAALISSWRSAFLSGTSFRWGVYLSSAPSLLVGTAALHYWSPASFRVELGLDLARSCWGQGYATEVTRALIDLGFDSLGVHRIEIRCHPLNAASVAIASKLGFTLEGILRDYVFVPGTGFVDEAVYSLLLRER